MTGDAPAEPEVVDLAALAREAPAHGPAWSHAGTDLNANLVVFDAGAGVDEHTNHEVEVLLVGIAGEGVVVVNGRALSLWAGQALVVPRGARRAIRAAGGRFSYLTCHRRRAALWPAGLPRPGAGSSAASPE